MRGRKQGLRVIAWFLILAMELQTLSPSLVTIANAAPSAEQAVLDLSDAKEGVSENAVQPDEAVSAAEDETETDELASEKEAAQGSLEKDIELSSGGFSSAGAVLNWTASGTEGVEAYLVYRNNLELDRVAAVAEQEEYSYTDESAEANASYTYQVYGADAEGNKLVESAAIVVETVEDWVVSEDYTLTENKTVQNLTITNGTLNLGSSQLIVLGDVNLSGGRLYVAKGCLECQNFTMSSWGYIEMPDLNSRIMIHGNFRSDSSYNTNTLTAGTIEIAGDFIGNFRYDNIFCPGSEHKVILNGTKKQTVSFSNARNYFYTLDIQNVSTAGGIYSDGIIPAVRLLDNGCNIDMGFEGASPGRTLSKDETIDGNLILNSGTLDLNGHKLTVTGDFIQPVGTVKINGGTLEVQGDYYIENKKDDGGEEVLSRGCGRLEMKNENDVIIVGGKFEMGSLFDNTGLITAGEIRVSGDVVQRSYNGITTNLVMGGTSKLILCGSGAQKVDFATTASSQSRVANLEITNEGAAGVTIGDNRLCVTGQVKDNGNKVTGYIAVTKNTVFESGSFTGSVYADCDYAMDGSLTIGGDFYQAGGTFTVGEGNTLTIGGNTTLVSCTLNPAGGTVIFEGDLLLPERYNWVNLNMANEKDRVVVKGNMTVSTYYSGCCTLTAGTLELKGDFTQTGGGFAAGGTHTTILSGDKKQTISFASADSTFNKLIVNNTSTEGIVAPNGLNVISLVIENGKVAGANGGIAGFTLEKDMELDGTTILEFGEMDLNGHTLTVNGDFIQTGGTVRINGGKLHVKGDYRIRTEKKDSQENPVYSASTGYLYMTNEADSVIVDGNFVMAANGSSEGKLTAGTLEVKGDVTQTTYANASNFAATEGFQLLLSGSGKQTVSFASSAYNTSRVPMLEITNKSADGVEITANHLCVTGQVKDNGNKVTGSVIPTGSTVFENGSFTGGIYAPYDFTMKDSLTIGGDFYQAGGTFTIGEGNTLTVGGNATLVSCTLNPAGGTFICEGNLLLPERYNWVNLNMANEKDRVVVKGNMTVSTYYSGCCTLTAGTLELQGDFTQSGGSGSFAAGGTHTTILNGNQKQTITFSSADSTFNKLIIRNTAPDGVYVANTLNAISVEVEGNSKVETSTGGIAGYQLDKDTTLTGDTVLEFGEMDLNGHTLTVNGDFIQMGGNVKVNGGKLHVKGDYRIRTEKKDSQDNPVYSASTGYLYMTNENDIVLVDGSFVMASNGSSEGKLTAGTLEVKGDVTQTTYANALNFAATEGFQLLLSGSKKQTVSFASSAYNTSRVPTLEITNESKDGVEIIANYLCVTKEVKDNGNKVTGFVIPTESTAFENDSFTGGIYTPYNFMMKDSLTIGGDFYQAGGTFTIGEGNTLTVGGNATLVSCTLNPAGGTFICEGNLLIPERYNWANLNMVNEKDRVVVKGSMTVSTYYSGSCSLTAGTLELQGDFTQSGGSGSFVAGKNHTTILNGDSKQTVKFASQDSMFGTLELENTSKDGVYFDCPIINALVFHKNNTIVHVNSIGIPGVTLTDDMVVEDDLYLISGEMDLNGHSLKVTGNLYVGNGTLNINKGSLEVGGDLRIQAVSFDEAGKPASFSASQGVLKMVNPEDSILVKGDFAIQSQNAANGNLCDGTLEIKGNFAQINGSYNDFQTSSDHKVILSGTKKQTVKFEHADGSYFTNLEITNSSKDGVSLLSNIRVKNSLKDENKKVAKAYTTYIPTIDTLLSDGFGGNLYVSDACSLTRDMEIAGSFTVNNNFDLNGFTLTTGNYTIDNGTTKISGGNLSVIGTLTVGGYGLLNMTNPDDYVCVTGAFTTSSWYDHSELLTDGTLEVRGDFTQNSNNAKNFAASGEHTTVLSGKAGTANRNYIQIVRFATTTGESKFCHLVLNKALSNYSFTPELNENMYADLKNEAKDDEAPMAVTGLKVVDTTATKVSLVWNAATDNEGVTGYEIYQGNTKIGTTSKTSFIDSGLKPNSTYVYKVYAFDAMRNLSAASESVSAMTLPDTTAPSVPAALKVKAKTGSAVTITWNASSDDVAVVGYKIYRDDVEIDSIKNVTSYKDTNVEKDELYTYQVAAFDEAGNCSGLSNAVKGSIAPPQIVRYTPAENTIIGGGSATLEVFYKNTGNASGNKVKFEYETENGSGEKIWEMIGGIYYGQKPYNTELLYSSCVWNYVGVDNGECNMRITLIDADGNEAVEKYTLYVDTEGPKPTDELKAKSEDGTVQLSWANSDSADCVKYKVYRSDSEDGSLTLLATVDENKYEDKTVVEGKTYYYCVAGLDNFNQAGAKSERVMVKVSQDNDLPKVTDVSVADKRINGIANISLSGTDNREIASFELEYRGEEEEEWTAIGTADAVENAAVFQWDTRDVADGKYQLKAVAVDGAGNRSDGVQILGDMEFDLEPLVVTTTVDNTGISKVQITSAVGYSTYVTLKWADVPDEDFAHFVVEQKAGEEYQTVGSTSTTLGMHIQNLMINTDYTFRVVGYDDLGNRGIPSDDVTVHTTADDQNPIIKAFGPANKYFSKEIPLSVTVTDNVGVKSLKLSYSQDKINWTELEELLADRTTKDYTFNYVFDVSGLEEGDVFVRAYAYDLYGNESEYEDEPIENNFVIDRTAPAKVTGIKAEGLGGYNEILWDPTPEEDVCEFRLYRAQEDVGNFGLLASGLTTNMYYDTAVSIGVVYSYKVVAVDMAGNVSEYSAEAVAQCQKDDEAPIVHAMDPADQSKLSGKAQIKALVSDNVSVKNVLFEYKPADSTDDIWTEIENVTVASETGCPQVSWDVSKFDNKLYTVRVTAYDFSDNISDPYVISYKVDTKAPAAPHVEGKGIGFGASLSWDKNTESDFDHYEIYRKLGSDEKYTLLTKTEDAGYEETGLLSGRKYQYKVYAYDDAGNYSVSNVCSVTPTDEDTEAPVAVASETLSVRVGSELLLDGTASHDNVKVVKYVWDMGNGDTVKGAIAKYVYKEMGTYQAKLTVYDAAGNSDTTVITVYVRSRISGQVTFKVVDQIGDTNYSLGYSYLYIESELGEKDYYNADMYGELTVVLSAGTYTVSAYKEGYMPKSYTIQVENGDDQVKTLILEKGELVTGTLTTKRLTLDQIRELGVDLQDPSNWYTYYYKLTYHITGRPTKQSVTIQLRPGHVSSVSGGSTTYYIALTEVEGQKVVTVYCCESYLKKMYDVCLTVTNNAEDGFGFDIEKSTATLNLPAGMSLLKINRPQSMTNDLDVLKAQETKETHWYIKADKPGSYNLSATFKGNLLPFNAPVQTTISASTPLEVSEKEDNTFTDDGFATDPKDYVIRVVDKRGVRVKGAIVSLESSGKKCQTITNSRGAAKLTVNKNEGRCFKLIIQHDDFPTYINESYTIRKNYIDTIKLYREGETPDEEDEPKQDFDSPYVKGYDIGLIAASMDGKSILRTSGIINRLSDENHTLNFTFTENVKKYELSLSGYGSMPTSFKNPFKTGDLNGKELSVTVNGRDFPVNGSITLHVIGDDDKEAKYYLGLYARTLLYDTVTLNYDDEIVDLLTEPYTVYTYFKDSYLDITCDLLDGVEGSIAEYALVQLNKEIATSTTGSFHLKIREFDPIYSVYLIAYDENGNEVSSDRLQLNIQKTPEIPTEFKLALGSDDFASVTLPDSVPFLGGTTMKLNLDGLDLPVGTEITPSGVKIMVNAPEIKIPIVPEKVEMSIKISGSLEGDFSSLDYVDVAGHLVFEISASGEWEQQFYVYVVPVVVAVEVSGGVTADGSATIRINSEGVQQISGALQLAIELGLDLYAGVGVANVASAGIYGAAGIRVDTTLLPKASFDKLTLSGEAGLRAKVLGHDFTLTLIEGDYPLYNRNTPSTDPDMLAGDWLGEEAIRAEMENPSNYRWSERTDVSDRTAWDGQLNENAISILQGGAYDGAVPKMTAAGDGAILLYTDDDLTKEVQNASTLKLAVYNGSGFSSPVSLSDSANAQYGFDSYEAEDGVYVVWQEVKEPISAQTGLEEMSKLIELKAAKIDALGAVTALGTITDNDVYEAEPQICVVDGAPAVIWYENSEGDLFGKKGTNSLMMARLSGGSWVSSELAADLGAIASMDAGQIGSSVCAAFAQPAGAQVMNLSTKQVTGIGAAQNLQFGYVATEPSLIWYNGGKVYATSEEGSYDTPLFDDVVIASGSYRYISDKNGNSTIVYSVAKDSKAEIYVSDYDAQTKQWGNTQALTDQKEGKTYFENITGAYTGGDLVLAFNQTVATLEKELLEKDELPIKRNLCGMKVEKKGAIRIEKIAFDSKEAIPGGDVDLTLELLNTGLKSAAADDITIIVKNSKGEEVARKTATSDIRAGKQTTETIRVRLPYTLTVNQLTVETEYADITSEKEVYVGDADLKVKAKLYAANDRYEIEATVENIGIESAGGKLVYYDKLGKKVLAETEFDELYYGEQFEDSFFLPDELLSAEKACSIEVRVETEAIQADEQNDIASIYLPEIGNRKPYTVTFDYNKPGTKQERRYVVSGNTVEMPKDPVWEGYTFLGWYDGESLFDAKTPINSNVKLVAKYQKITPPDDPTDDPNKPDDPTDDPNKPGKDPTTPDNPSKPDDPNKPGDEAGQKPGDDVGQKPGDSQKPSDKPDESAALPKKNVTQVVGGVTYKVTKADAKNGTVSVTKISDKKKTSVTIPATVKINGYTFKVTEIGKNAFKNNKKLKSVTIGKNITKIGANAFYSCKSLKKVTFKTTKLKSIGKNAFKKINAKAKVKVPAKKLKLYKKLLKKAGLPKGAKVRK